MTTLQEPVRRFMPPQKVAFTLQRAIRTSTLLWSKSPKDAGHNAYDLLQSAPEVETPTQVRSATPSNTTNLRKVPGVEEWLDIARIQMGADRVVNGIVYHPNGIMDWHTNSNMPGRKVYISFTMGEAMFAYRHPITGAVIDDIDNIGWTAREFLIPANPPYLWHAVHTQKLRFTFGFWYQEDNPNSPERVLTVKRRDPANSVLAARAENVSEEVVAAKAAAILETGGRRQAVS